MPAQSVHVSYLFSVDYGRQREEVSTCSIEREKSVGLSIEALGGADSGTETDNCWAHADRDNTKYSARVRNIARSHFKNIGRLYDISLERGDS